MFCLWLVTESYTAVGQTRRQLYDLMHAILLRKLGDCKGGLKNKAQNRVQVSIIIIWLILLSSSGFLKEANEKLEIRVTLQFVRLSDKESARCANGRANGVRLNCLDARTVYSLRDLLSPKRIKIWILSMANEGVICSGSTLNWTQWEDANWEPRPDLRSVLLISQCRLTGSEI